jgi:hypothetical protein
LITRLFAGLYEQMDRAWVWFYTAGMEPEAAEARRLELASDQFEMTAFASSNNWRGRELCLQRLVRWLAGVPADLSWRIGRGTSGLSRAGMPDLLAALLLIIGGTLLLPLSLLLTISGHRFGTEAQGEQFFFFALAVIGLLVIGGFLLQDYRPRLGAVIVSFGGACVALPLWWSVSAPAAAVLAVAFVALRARRERS